MLPDSPLLVAANRDEHYDRPSASPAILETVPRVLAGRDLRAGGTWLGVNEHGVLAAMLNRRPNAINAPLAGARSRGLLCMDLLSHRSAAAAAQWVSGHDAEYPPFTALMADESSAHVAYNAGPQRVTRALAPGLHVFSSAAEFDLHSSKAECAYDLFGALGQQLREPGQDVRQRILAPLHGALSDHSLPSGSADPGDAICVHRETSGTVSSSIARLVPSRSHWELYHCPGAPCRAGFNEPVELSIR